MHTHPQQFTLLLLAIASLASLPGTNAQELVGSTHADNPSPIRWAPDQAPPLWQPLAPAGVNVARENVLPMESSTPSASTRDNVRRQLVRTNHPIDAKLKQLEFDYAVLGTMLAADAVRVDADYHLQRHLSELDVELQQVANRVLYADGRSNTADKIVVPDFIAFQSQLDATTAELAAEVENELRTSDQRVLELRHEPASGPVTSKPQTNSAGRRVSQRPLKATLTNDEIQRFADEFSTQRTLLRLQQRLSPLALGWATQMGYLQYLQRMLGQDKQVLAALSADSLEWSEPLRGVVELERAIAKKIDDLASTTSADEDQLAATRYAVIRVAAAGAAGVIMQE